ncbi:MAP kinase kinase (MEK) [Elasticomyces elasticus]|nr:MAP kinase kinase (MEK) [Elasticomyces elasticus]KAK4965541.1 MAP kinase kinase (MEK) [Elasticomyces elasticus]
MGDTDPFKARTMKRKNVKGLALSAPAKPATPTPSEPDTTIPAALGQAQGRRDDILEIGVEYMPKWKTEDLEVLKDLGAGNGGTVSKVRHKEWNLVMARKIIHVEAKKEVRKRIVRELEIMRECNSPYIVSFYGAFMNESGDVTMCMEYADVGSLDSISREFGPVRVDVLGKIAEAMLGGLSYLYSAHRIMHRDIKPSNVLVNSKGQIKLCDFGVSSALENSVADTFVGTGTYMAPERIQGANYSVKSDVWSVGLTLMELAIGKFPFSIESEEGDDEDAAGPQGILDLLQQIVLEPSPRLPKSDAFPKILEDVIDKCLMKDPAARPTPKELYETDAFLQAAKRTPVDLEAWAVSLMEKHNRKSHLAPMLSPATQALLRGEETPGTANTMKSSGSSKTSSSTLPTPTSGEIPISAISNGSSREVRNRAPESESRVRPIEAESRRRAEPMSQDVDSRRRVEPARQVDMDSRSRPADTDYRRRAEPVGQFNASNGGGSSRPPYPTRTSSTQVATVASNGQPPMQLPIRQAPPSSRTPRPDAGERSDGSYRSERSERSERRPKPSYVQ